MHEGALLPGVDVAGVDLAGLDRAAAARRLRAELPDISAGSLTVHVATQDATIPYADFDRDYDIDYMLDQAFAVGRQGNFVDQLAEQIGLLRSGVSIPAVMTFDSEELARQVAAVATAAEVPVVDANVARKGGNFEVSPSHAGTAIDVAAVVSQAVAAVTNLSGADTQVSVDGTTVEPAVTTEVAQAAADKAERVISTPLTLSGEELTTTIEPATLRGWVHLDPAGVGQWNVSIEEGPITQYVAAYGAETNIPAKNATFSLVNNKIQVVPSAPGRATDVAPSATNVLAALQARVDGQVSDSAALAFSPVEPTLGTDEARAIAPRVHKLGEWTTNYIPGPLNGNGVNIQIPTRTLDGVVVEPGGEFDFLTSIGPITSPPYESGGALVHGQIQPDGIIGGGMCSVSTTLFNAAVRYGLPIWARINHSLYISRYPVGLDATVWMTGPKNRHTMGFVNDTGYPLVVRGINSPGAVTFQLWGVDDGRTVEMSEARIENTESPTYALLEYTNDLPPGRRDHLNDAYDSFDSWVTRIVRDATGAVVIEETYKSHYKMLPAYTRVGRSDGDPRAGRVVHVRLNQ